MATISEIAKRLNDYVSNLDANLIEALTPVESQILDINRFQMLNSKGADDKALINNRTGNAKLSKQYARRQRKEYPDIFVSGDYQRDMFIEVKNMDEYLISSSHRLVKYIPVQYENVHGIAPSNRDEAYKITTPAIARHLQNKVFK
jgi:hypothetical protein